VKLSAAGAPIDLRHGLGVMSPRFSLRNFGAAFVLQAPRLDAPLVGDVRGTLTMSTGTDNIVSAVDAAGGSIVLSRPAIGRECTWDTTNTFNGRGGIRAANTAALRSLTGGVSAANAPHYQCALAKPNAVAANVSNLATFILYGMAGATNSGIGSMTPPDRFAYGGNVISFTQDGAFDSGVHYFELAYDGTTQRFYIDGVYISSRTVALTFNGASPESIGIDSWFGAARAIQDTTVHLAAFRNSVPTFAERMNFAMLAGEGAHSIPMRIDGKGDSRTLGTGSTAGNDFLTQLGLQFSNNGRPVTMVNHGLSGKRSDEIATALNVVDVGELHSPFCVNVSILWPGYNDCNQYITTPTTAEAIYANTRLMIDFERAYGNKVFVMTVPTSGPFQTAPDAEHLRVAYNALVIANAGAADGVIDLAPYFEPYDAGDFSDTLHFTDASQLLIAEIVYDYLSTRV